MWIDDSGLLFVGAEAITRGEQKAIDGRRQRLDSLKQLISQASSLDMLTHTTLSPAENPTAYPVTPDDAVSIYLGYLTDLANTALDGRSSRYVRRRLFPALLVEDAPELVCTLHGSALWQGSARRGYLSRPLATGNSCGRMLGCARGRPQARRRQPTVDCN